MAAPMRPPAQSRARRERFHRLIEDFGPVFASKRYRDLARFSVLSHLLMQTAYRTPKFLSVVSANPQDI